MELILSLLQQTCVYLVIAYMLSKTPLILPLLSISSRLSHKISCYVLFSLFCIMGTYFGLQINDAIANTRAMGAVMGGLFGGPVVGFAVGFTGGIHRYSLGGFTDLACAISTTAEGLIGGLLHVYLVKKNKASQLFNPLVVFSVTLFAEIIQMLILLAVAKPFEQSYALVSDIAAPMIIANSVGAALFMSIIQDRKTIFEKYSATFSRRALTIAERSVGILHGGFNSDNAQKIVRIIYEETNVGAVAITDREKFSRLLALAMNTTYLTLRFHRRARLPRWNRTTSSTLMAKRTRTNVLYRKIVNWVLRLLFHCARGMKWSVPSSCMSQS